MANDREMTCDRCRKAVPSSDMKYLPKEDGGIRALCGACREILSPDNKHAGVKKQPLRAGPQGKMLYYCHKCKYKFKFDHDVVTRLKCPYCGEDGKVTEYKNETAASILKSCSEE